MSLVIIPRPDLVGGFGQQLGLLVDGMAALVAAFADFAVFGQDAIHGADRAMIDALVQQDGMDLRGARSTNRGVRRRSGTWLRSSGPSVRGGANPVVACAPPK